MATLSTSETSFDPRLWLSALTMVGGGYALAADRRLAFLVHDVASSDLAPVMAQIVGQPERQEAVKAAIERRRNGEA